MHRLALDAIRTLAGMQYRGLQSIDAFPSVGFRAYCIRLYFKNRIIELAISEDELMFTLPDTVVCQLMARIDSILDRESQPREREKIPLRTIEI